MREYLQQICDVILDRTAVELLGAIVVALVASLAMSGIYALVRRKVSDATALVAGMVLLASLACMAVSASHIAHARRAAMGRLGGPLSRYGPPRDRPMLGPPMESFLSLWITKMADTDRDGLVSADEASVAAARFVREAGAEGEEAVNREALTEAIRQNLFPQSPGTPGGPPGAYPHGGPEGGPPLDAPYSGPPPAAREAPERSEAGPKAAPGDPEADGPGVVE
jgi:hypothetical protein